MRSRRRPARRTSSTAGCGTRCCWRSSPREGVGTEVVRALSPAAAPDAPRSEREASQERVVNYRRDHRPERSLPVSDLRARPARLGARRGLAASGMPTASATSTSSRARWSPRSATATRRRAGHRRAGAAHPARLQPPLLRAASAARRAARAPSSFADRVFFCNSGAEANEAAIKLARKYGHEHGGGRYEIITALRLLPRPHPGHHRRHRPGEGAASASSRCRRAFATPPTTTSTRSRPRSTPRTIAVMLEPVQGEGGVVVPRRGLPAPRARAVRPARSAADPRRGADRHGPHGQPVRLRADRRRARHHDPRQGPRQRRSASAPCSPAARWRAASAPARTARPSAATPSPAPSALAVLRRDARGGRARELPRHGRAPAPAAARRCARRHAIIRDVRGRGLLIGVELDEPGAAVVEAAATRVCIINCTANKRSALRAAADRQRRGDRRSAGRSSSEMLSP